MSFKNQLSKREIEVMDHVHQGKISKEIATNLCVSVETVNTHTKNIRRKTEALNIADITRIFRVNIQPYILYI